MRSIEPRPISKVWQMLDWRCRLGVRLQVFTAFLDMDSCGRKKKFPGSPPIPPHTLQRILLSLTHEPDCPPENLGYKMPGRQSHGRSVTAGRPSRKGGKTKPKGRVSALDAFAVAEAETPANRKGARTRDLDPEPEQKRRRPHDANEEEDADGAIAPDTSRLKRRKTDPDDEDSLDGGSDSEGNEWHVGLGDDDDDSEIDSDDAFGDSDEERFEGFALRGSSSAKNAGDANDDDSEGDDSESLGEDAIDLAQALDDISEGEDEQPGRSGSESEDDKSAPDMPETDDDDDDDEGDDDQNSAKYDALRDLVNGLDNGGTQAEAIPKANAKIQLEDLGLFGVKDANIQKSLKLFQKEEKATKPGSAKKLDVPLARRQQDRLHRIAAAEQANKTLDRWTDTVKQNRRAEHLVFPLPDLLPGAGLDTNDLRPLNRKNAETELESTILSIMEESGLGPSTKPATEEQQGKHGGQTVLSKSELQSLWTERRRARDLESREQARAKRIKKIKSKSFRRVQRRKAMKELAAMEGEEMDAEEGGHVESEDEREAQHVRRATERMGSRHRDSKWAKLAKNTGRAAWDDDFRAGLNEMARRDEELRRRVEGRGDGLDEDGDASDESGADDGDTRERLLRDLREAETLVPNEPTSNILKMPFMRKAEAERKKMNDETIAQIRRELTREEGESDEEEEDAEIGRRTYGMAGANELAEKAQSASSTLNGLSRGREFGDELTADKGAEAIAPGGLAWGSQSNGKGEDGWTEPKNRKERRRARRARETESLPATASDLLAPPPQKPGVAVAVTDDAASDDTPSPDMAVEGNLVVKSRSVSQLARHFAADDQVEADFAAEKAQVAEDEGDKVIDNTLPGWGSWVGEGVSKRAVKRDQKKFQTVVKGVKQADRKDARLERVIINERRVKKVRLPGSSRRTVVARLRCVLLTTAVCRTTGTWPRSCLTSSKTCTNINARSDCPWAPSGRPRSRSRTRPNHASYSNKGLLHPWLGPYHGSHEFVSCCLPGLSTYIHVDGCCLGWSRELLAGLAPHPGVESSSSHAVPSEPKHATPRVTGSAETLVVYQGSVLGLAFQYFHVA